MLKFKLILVSCLKFDIIRNYIKIIGAISFIYKILMVSIILKGRIMCMRKVVLNVGEKLFNVFFIVSLIVGPYSAIMSGRSIGGRAGLVTSISQSLMSIGATLTVALVVYSLLEIRHKLSKDNG